MNDSDLSERVRRNIERQKSIMRWAFVVVHLLFCVFALILVATEPFQAGATNREAQLLVFLLVSLFMHFMSALISSGRIDKRFVGRAVNEELGQEIMADYLSKHMSGRLEKPKRDRAQIDADYVTVNDEGELVPDSEKRKADHSG